ncbi:hypothetical protein RRG08_040248 [Elysia crispata]|uniref:Uncharacterized protein n=1 Tax=Elysia crispata TaxID=231223 RepID=A0AAE0Y002_9GAST|nr:hypothetical protein RRG08_040248 [Elysia crispata]
MDMKQLYGEIEGNALIPSTHFRVVAIDITIMGRERQMKGVDLDERQTAIPTQKTLNNNHWRQKWVRTKRFVYRRNPKTTEFLRPTSAQLDPPPPPAPSDSPSLARGANTHPSQTHKSKFETQKKSASYQIKIKVKRCPRDRATDLTLSGGRSFPLAVIGTRAFFLVDLFERCRLRRVTNCHPRLSHRKH